MCSRKGAFAIGLAATVNKLGSCTMLCDRQSVCFSILLLHVQQRLEAGSVLLSVLKRALSTNKQGRRILTIPELIASPIALPGKPVLPVAPVPS